MNDVRNGSIYNCVITSRIAILRQIDPTILYVAGEYLSTYVRMYVRMYVCMYVCMYACIHV